MKIALGIGCDRNTGIDTLTAAVTHALTACTARPGDIAVIGSIDLKADEAALLQLAADLGVPIRFFPPPALAAVPVPNPSETVRRHTGTPSVSEAAALLAGGEHAQLIIEKWPHRGQDGRNATVSIARIPE